MANSYEKPSRREVNLFFNNMVCLVKAMEGQYTTVDLRGESCVTGKIVYVDGFMNVEMEDCTYYNPRGDIYPLDTFFVKKRNIRYVHIPDGQSATELVQNQIDSMRDVGQQLKPKKPQRFFKKKRAEEYHKQTLRDITVASTSKQTSRS